MHALNAYLPILNCFLKLAMHAFSKASFYKNGTEENFASQWLSTSPNSMIGFKFYVQTPFFSTFITPHLGKGHIRTVNRHSGPYSVCYGQFNLVV